MTSTDPARLSQAVSELSTLLERAHGVGLRGSGWVNARLERALAALSEEAGGVDAALCLLRGDPTRLASLAEVLRVGETRFYRDPQQWQALAHAAVPEWLRGGRLRALSVGCSTGEETWTLAMVLDHALTANAASSAASSASSAACRVVGVDRSEAAVAVASLGRYDAQAAEQLPTELRQQYLLRSDDGQSVAVDSRLHRSVTFLVRDALAGPPPGRWELIVCKNLLIYFSDEAAARVISSLLRALSDGGLLLVARSEVARLRALGHRGEELAAGVTVFRA